MSTSLMIDRVLDCSGLACPLPIFKTKKAIDEMPVGSVLQVISTDPGSPSDMDAWTRKTGHHLLRSELQGTKYVFYIEKAV